MRDRPGENPSIRKAMVPPGSPPAVILGFELNGLGVARALSRHGVKCIGLAGPLPNPAWKTNTCKVVACAEWSQQAVVTKLVEIAGAHTRKLPLLITKDVSVRWVSEARDELAGLYEIALPEKPMVETLLDKAAFSQLSTREGWPIPRTWMIHSKEALLSVLEEVPFPCILKPETHTDFFGQRSPRKAFKLSNADELVRTYDMAAQWTDGFVLQEWIEGGDDRIAFCLTYVGRDGTPQAAFAGRKLRQFPPECGNTALCEPAPPAWREPLCSLTEQIWRSVRFRGLGSIEYKMRLDSDQPVIMEPTVGRTNYQNELAVLNGVNIPLIAYCDLVGLPRPTVATPSRSYKLVDGPREFLSARYYWHNGTLTRRQWLRDRRGRGRYMTLRARDPGPFVASLRGGVRPLAGILVESVFGRAAKERLKRAIQSTRSS
jgi:D-aspartate ligase